MTDFFSTLKKRWSGWLEVAAWMATLVGMFLLQPPVLTLSGTGGVDPSRFAQFMFAVVAAILLQVFNRRAARDRVIRLRWAAVLAVAAVALFFGYMASLASWTCQYAARWQVVIGLQYTPDAQQTANNLPDKGGDCASVLQEYAGKAELVWNPSETRPRYLALQALYMALWISSACAFVLTLQGWGDQTPSRRASRGDRPAKGHST